MRHWEVVLLVVRLLFLIALLSRLENFVSEALQPVALPSLMLSLGVENAYSIQEPIVLTQSRPVLGPGVAQPLHIGHRAIRLPLFVIRLRGSWLA
jgi:hypothetical protein